MTIFSAFVVIVVDEGCTTIVAVIVVVTGHACSKHCFEVMQDVKR